MMKYQSFIVYNFTHETKNSIVCQTAVIDVIFKARSIVTHLNHVKTSINATKSNVPMFQRKNTVNIWKPYGSQLDSKIFYNSKITYKSCVRIWATAQSRLCQFEGWCIKKQYNPIFTNKILF